MKAKRMETINLEIGKPYKLCRADVLLKCLQFELSHKKGINPVMALNITNAFAEAADHTPAHNGTAMWTKQKNGGWKYICTNCFQVAYFPPSDDGKCGYTFCPNCGCIMKGYTD